jgi:hypothetical protein
MYNKLIICLKHSFRRAYQTSGSGFIRSCNIAYICAVLHYTVKISGYAAGIPACGRNIRFVNATINPTIIVSIAYCYHIVAANYTSGGA